MGASSARSNLPKPLGSVRAASDGNCLVQPHQNSPLHWRPAITQRVDWVHEGTRLRLWCHRCNSVHAKCTRAASGGRRMGVGPDLGCIERGADQCECPYPVGHFKELPAPLVLVRCSDTVGRVGGIRLGRGGLGLRRQMTMKIVLCAIRMCYLFMR